ncbi:hypothetical protein [Bdellovibrio sp. HCB337]|uniref:hypothetical protein n=1 Tax=Bdellovibrio sp. HCB337 TaxID=3394358 RepID=UPI0039A76269
MNIPEFIVHYSRGIPFRSMSGLSQKELAETLKELNDTNVWGLRRFSDPEYLHRRLKVEQKIRHSFVGKGGRPELDFPIYFFLGNNARFEEHKSNVGYKINLADVPSHVVSFTYGDSMFSMCENYRQKLGDEYQSHLCSQIYRLDELKTLLSAIEKEPQKLHIECQLWIKPTVDMFTRIG